MVLGADTVLGFSSDKIFLAVSFLFHLDSTVTLNSIRFESCDFANAAEAFARSGLLLPPPCCVFFCRHRQRIHLSSLRLSKRCLEVSRFPLRLNEWYGCRELAEHRFKPTIH